MRQATIERILVADPEEQLIEIFCREQYKGYYVRGQIAEMCLQLSTYPDRRLVGDVTHRTMILALVNDSYQERCEEYSFTSEGWGVLFKNTEDEFLKAQKAHLRKEADFRASFARSLGGTVVRRPDDLANPTLVIDLDEADIRDTPYLRDSLEAKKDVVLLHIETFITEAEVRRQKDREGVEELGERIYMFPVILFNETRAKGRVRHDVRDWFDQLYHTLYFRLDYGYMDRRQWSRVLRNIGGLACEWIATEVVDRSPIDSLNEVRRGIGDRSYPVTDYLYRFFDDLIDHLTTRKRVAKCQFCGGFFRLTPLNKKYCSLKSEDKDCGEKARDHHYYEEHKDQILAKARNRRALQKKIGSKNIAHPS